MEMKASILKQLWSIVEKTPTYILLSLSDRDLRNLLLRKVKQNYSLTSYEDDNLANYIEAKSCLIRDIAEFRLA